MEELWVKDRLRLLPDHFGKVGDPREACKVKYPLAEVLFLVTCASIAGCDDCDEIADWGDHHLDFLRRHGEYPFGTPRQDWLRVVLNRIDPALFEACFTSWARTLRADAPDLIALDGKTLRRSGDEARNHKPLHVVSAWASTQRLVLAQEAVDAKDNECAAILAIVERLDIKAALVTIDAIATNPAVAHAVTAAGGDYLLALKRNPPSLHDEVKAYFADPSTPGLATFTTTDKDHGRIETRTTRVSHDVGWMTGQRRHPGEHRFPALASLIETTTRTERRGRITRDTRLFHLLGAPDPRARRPGHPQPLGRGEPALGAGRDLQGGSVPPAQGTRRPEHGPGAKAGLQHGPGRPRQTIHQDRPKGRRMEPRRPRLVPPASIVLTWTRRRV